MSFEKNNFNQEGLVLDKDRVLTYSKLSCPLECRYCFVDDLSSAEQQKGVVYLSPEQLELMKSLPDEVSLIMLGCDTEFFQHRKDALDTLRVLIELKRDVSVITKLALPEKYLTELASIAEELGKQGNIFSFSVSLPCLESSKIWEPKVPDPERRIELIKEASYLGLNTFVAMRPLLPTVSNDELARIIESTKESVIGYYSGPLYLKNLDPALLPENILETLSVELLQPHWMPEGNLFYKVERPGQMEFLQQTIADSGKLVFDGAAEANEYLRNHEKH